MPRTFRNHISGSQDIFMLITKTQKNSTGNSIYGCFRPFWTLHSTMTRRRMDVSLPWTACLCLLSHSASGYISTGQNVQFPVTVITFTVLMNSTIRLQGKP